MSMHLLNAPRTGILPHWIGAWWTERAWDEMEQIGNLVYISSDAQGSESVDMQKFYNSNLNFVLIFYFTQDRLLDQVQWRTYCSSVYRWMTNKNIHHRCIGMCFGDELYELVATNRHPHWPVLDSVATPRYHLLPILAEYLSQRAQDVREIFGSNMKPLGFHGTGGIDVPVFKTCEWLGVNAYINAPINASNFNIVRRIYAGVETKGLPIVMSLPTFRDHSGMFTEAPTVAQLAWYLELIQKCQPVALMYFCLHTPTAYDPRHGARSYGLTDMPELMQVLKQIWAGRMR